MADARKAVGQAIPDSLEWATPVLFMRSPDGILFEMPAVEVRPEALPAEEREEAGAQYLKAGRHFYQLLRDMIRAEESKGNLDDPLQLAIRFYEDAIRWGQREVEVLSELIEICGAAGEVHRAVTTLREVIREDPNNAELQSLLRQALHLEER